MPSPLNSHIFPNPRNPGYLSIVYAGEFGQNHQTISIGYEMTREEIAQWTAMTITLSSIHPMLKAPDCTARRLLEMIES